MKLSHITFAGLDESTNIRELHKIQQQYPIAQFALCVSFNYMYNCNWYASPYFIDSIPGKSDLNLQLQIYGKAADCILRNCWTKLDYLTNWNAQYFKHVQLKIADQMPWFKCPEYIPENIKELTIQQKNFKNLVKYHQIKMQCPSSERVDVFLEEANFEADYKSFVNLKGLPKIGYNVDLEEIKIAEALNTLLDNPQKTEFWIEIKNAVRTDGWFDLAKVERILYLCQGVIDAKSKS